MLFRSIGQVIDNQRVVELPLNGRQAQYLILLAGGATLTPQTGNLNSTKNYPTIVISVAGGNAKDITYSLDGGTHNDPYNNQSYPLAFPDALQEFKIETAALTAQYGQHSAASVNAVTKSGTNDFHGDAFEFVRNGVFNARNAFATKRDTLKRNQFGAMITGPIKKDRTFFLGAIELMRDRLTLSETDFLPGANAQNGIITNAQGNAITGYLANKDGVILQGAPQPITIDYSDLVPVQTTKANFEINLSSKAETPSTRSSTLPSSRRMRSPGFTSFESSL